MQKSANQHSRITDHHLFLKVARRTVQLQLKLDYTLMYCTLRSFSKTEKKITGEKWRN